MKSLDRQYAISRIDNDENGTYAWKVHVQRRKQLFVRMFTDGVYGGKAKALSAAKKYRDEMIAKHPRLTRREYASIKRKNNTSGVPGVCRYIDSSNGKRRVYWTAYWTPEEGKPKRVKFSVKKYGEKKARALAVNARERALEELEGFFVRSPRAGARSAKSPGPTLAPPKLDLRVKRVRFSRSKLSVELQDERVIAVPLSWYPKLKSAHQTMQHAWELSETGHEITWPKLDLRVSTAALLVSKRR